MKNTRLICCACSGWMLRFVAHAMPIVLLAQTSAAQSTVTSISFQGVLNGPNNAPLANGVYDLRFRFWDGPAPGGSVVSTNIPVAAPRLKKNTDGFCRNSTPTPVND